VRKCEACSYANRQSTFVENIFVLSVAEDQGSFRAGADYEFGAADPGERW